MKSFSYKYFLPCPGNTSPQYVQRNGIVGHLPSSSIRYFVKSSQSLSAGVKFLRWSVPVAIWFKRHISICSDFRVMNLEWLLNVDSPIIFLWSKWKPSWQLLPEIEIEWNPHHLLRYTFIPTYICRYTTKHWQMITTKSFFRNKLSILWPRELIFSKCLFNKYSRKGTAQCDISKMDLSF